MQLVFQKLRISLSIPIDIQTQFLRACSNQETDMGQRASPDYYTISKCHTIVVRLKYGLYPKLFKSFSKELFPSHSEFLSRKNC